MVERFFEEVELPNLQESENGLLFPAVLFPGSNIDKNTCLSLPTLIQAIKAHKPWLESLLHKSGAVLFRGFPVTSASDFNDVVEAFGYADMPYLGGSAYRSNVIGRVFTANEGPPEQKIHFHHEMSYASNFPTKLFFYCEVEPGRGGETAIVLSHLIYDKMNERYPEFVAELKEQGLIYSRVTQDEDDISSPTGRGWKSTFSTNDKSIAEQRATALGLKLKWMENDEVEITTGVRPGIKFDEARRQNTWFNGLAVTYGSPEDAKDYDLGQLITFGNGNTLPGHAVYDSLKITEEEAVPITWQKGDILFLDNMAVLHARLPLITPPRRILASLCR